MSINIKVSTDALRDQSNLVREDVRNIDRNWKNIGKLITSSRSYWEGEASDAHVKVYREIEADVEKVIKRLGDNAVKLQQDAGIYEEVENAVKGETGQLKSDIF